jgi:hypothetical protein
MSPVFMSITSDFNGTEVDDYMASINFEKLHSVASIIAIMRHCDREERLKHEHANKDINPELTKFNFRVQSDDDYRDYEYDCKHLTDYLDELDSRPGKNKRSDRVRCFSLEVPLPQGLLFEDEEDEEQRKKHYEKQSEWFCNVYDCIVKQYGQHNVICAYVHYDEVHDYISSATGEKMTSRPHMHVLVVPEHEGKLNGKWFSSSANMKKLNNTVDTMTRMYYGCNFMDGSKKKGTSVEDMKRQSEKLYNMAVAYCHEHFAELATEHLEEMIPSYGKFKASASKKASKTVHDVADDLAEKLGRSATVEDVAEQLRTVGSLSREEREERLREEYARRQEELQAERAAEADSIVDYGNGGTEVPELSV